MSNFQMEILIIIYVNFRMNKIKIEHFERYVKCKQKRILFSLLCIFLSSLES